MILDVGCGANIYHPSSIPKGDVNCGVLKPIKRLRTLSYVMLKIYHSKISHLRKSIHVTLLNMLIIHLR